MKQFSLVEGDIDAHCHLSDPRLAAMLPEILGRAEIAGIRNFLLAGVDPEDWLRQRNFVAGKAGFFPCFGLHPYFTAKSPDTVCEAALIELEKSLPGSFALGECGLDFRSDIVGAGGDEVRVRQKKYFSRQLELAVKHRKVPILHIVRAHAEAIVLLQVKLAGARRPGLVHAFNSGARIAQSYLDQGFYLSIGGPLLRKNNHDLHEAVRKMPMGRLLLESDAPDQAPPGWPQKWNEPSSILLVAGRVAELKNTTEKTVLAECRKNFQTLFAPELAEGNYAHR